MLWGLQGQGRNQAAFVEQVLNSGIIMSCNTFTSVTASVVP